MNLTTIIPLVLPLRGFFLQIGISSLCIGVFKDTALLKYCDSIPFPTKKFRIFAN